MVAPPRPRELRDPPGLVDGLTLPMALTASLRLTPEQFAQLCDANPDAVLELAADGSLIPITPTGSETGARNGELFFQIKTWARARGGWMAFDSSTGFRLPDNSVLSPDASLVALAHWQALSANERRGFAPLCPDLVVELASPSDEGHRGLTALRRKMAAYQRNGARLGWLLIPEEQAVEVWGPQQAGAETPQRIAPASSISADPLFPGLVINLDELWAS